MENSAGLNLFYPAAVDQSEKSGRQHFKLRLRKTLPFATANYFTTTKPNEEASSQSSQLDAGGKVNVSS